MALESFEDIQEVKDKAVDTAIDTAEKSSLSNLITPAETRMSKFTPWALAPAKPLVDRSIIATTFMRDTATGSFFGRRSAREFDPSIQYDFVSKVVTDYPDLVDFVDRFSLDQTDEQLAETASMIRRELDDKAFMAQHPWKTLGAGFITQPFDFVNWLPGGVFYKNAKRGATIARAAAGLATAGFVSTVAQEGIIQEGQLARTAEESAWNIVTSTMLSGIIGGLGGVWTTRNKARIEQDMLDILTNKPLEFNPDGLPADTRIARMSKPVQKALALSPKQRMASSNYEAARLAAQALYENPLITEGNLKGETSLQGVEALNYTDIAKLAPLFLEAQTHFLKYKGVNPDGITPLKGIRAKMAKAPLSNEQIDATVSRMITTGEKNADPNIQGIHDAYRKIYDSVNMDAADISLLLEGQVPVNANAYNPIMYNLKKIVESGGRDGPFMHALIKGYNTTNELAKTFWAGPNIKKIMNTIKQLSKDSKVKGILASEKKAIAKQVKDLRADINKMAPDMIKDSQGKARKPQSKDVIEANAMQSVDRALGDVNGQDLTQQMARLRGTPSALKGRQIKIDQASMQEWHLQDPAKVADAHVRSMIPMINMTRRAKELGYKSIEEWKAGVLADMKTEFDSKVRTGKDAVKEKKKFNALKQDITDSFEMVMGTYGYGPNTMNSSAANYLRNIRSWNYVRLLGMMTVSSVADVGMQMFMHGPAKFIFHGIVPALKNITVKNSMTKQDMKVIGFGLETIMGSRVKSLSDAQHLESAPGFVSRTLDTISQTFANAALMNQWNDVMQHLAFTQSVHRTLDAAAKLSSGQKVAQKELTRLRNLGISHESIAIIAEKTRNNIDGPSGTRYTDWGNWKIGGSADAKALREFQVATRQDINATVIVPGIGSVPRFAHTSMGKSIFQFKSFIFAANEKVLASGIQRKADADMWIGLSTMVGFGMMSYVLTSLIRGQEPDLSFSNLAMEGVDRSGILGIWMEVYNIGSKLALVPGGGVSKYRSRGVFGALGGPTAGLTDDVITMLSKIMGGKSLTTKDAQRFMRLLPYENLAYLYRLNRAITNEAALGLGFEDAR